MFETVGEAGLQRRRGCRGAGTEERGASERSGRRVRSVVRPLRVETVQAQLQLPLRKYAVVPVLIITFPGICSAA